MAVHALVTSIRTGPEPTVLALLDSLDEELANLVGGGLGVAVLAHDDVSQLGLVPISHVVLLLLITLVVVVAGVGVQALLLALHADGRVVGELAFFALVAGALFEELTQDRLGVDAKGHLLDLDRLEEFGSLALGGLGGLLLLLAEGLFGVLFLLLRRLGGVVRGLHGFDLALGGTTLFVLHTERLVDGDLGRLGLVSLLGRHGGGCVESGAGERKYIRCRRAYE